MLNPWRWYWRPVFGAGPVCKLLLITIFIKIAWMMHFDILMDFKDVDIESEP